MLRIGICASLLILTGTFAQEQRDVPRFRVAVDAVRIDAVVTDRDGHVVTDLTADDFELRQDGKLQKVTFAEFVPVITDPPSDSPTARSARTTRAELPIAPPPLKREDVQRTFAIVVDDLGLSMESFINARKALHAFLDDELRPGDLAAIVRTGGSTGALQPFTTDRRVLHAAVDSLRWNAASRNAVEPYEPVNSFKTFDTHGSGMADADDFKVITRLRSSISAAGTLGAVNLIIQGARDLPGRKALVFVSEGFELLANGDPDFRVRRALDRAVDQATRAGVVIYALDARGLQTAGLQAADNLKSPGKEDLSLEAAVRRHSGERFQFNRDTQESLAYLAEQTGGFAVMNNNDLGRGLGRIADDVRDYYVIGYVPDERTFAMSGNTPHAHKIDVKVRRPGLRVKTRKTFLGVSDPEEAAGPMTTPQQLVHAAISPFAATDIALGATMLPGYAPERGTFVRALLHIDARALTFVDDEGGKKTASADVLGMAFDQDGTEVAHLSTGFAVALTDQAAADALQEGLVYTLRIPIRRPGGYQIRFAVRDRRSGRLGSAGRFVEMPDIAGGAFALSGIVLRSDDPQKPGPTGDEPVLTAAQALRVYAPGTPLTYAYEIYNAAGPVRSTMSIWRGEQKVSSIAPATLTPPAGGERRFSAAGGIRLGEHLPAGNYILQISAAMSDPKHPERAKTALQRIEFDVR